MVCHIGYGEPGSTRPPWESTVSGRIRRRPRVGLTLLALSAVACAGKPIPVEMGVAEEAPPVQVASQWRYASDSQRIHAIAATTDTVWAASQDGLIRWTRPKGAVGFPTGEDVPSGVATALAATADGTLYVGTRSGLSWRDPSGRWSRLDHAVVAKGVTALAPRRGGGVWVGLSPGLGWMVDNELRVVSTIHRINTIAVDLTGRVWMATAGHGVITVLGERIIEHTTGQGVCGNRVRDVGIGPGGRIAAVCGGPQAAVAVLEGGRWYPLSVVGAGHPQQLQWVGRGWVLRTDDGWTRLEHRPPAHPSKVSTPVAPADLVPIAPAVLPPEPSQPVTARVAPSASASPASKPPPVAMPAPIAASTAPRVRLDAPFARTRAPATIRGVPSGAPRYRFTDYAPLLPEDATVTYWGLDPTGTSWFGVAHQGVVAQRGSARERYVSLDLVPRHEEIRLVVDADGRALIPSLGPYVYQGTPEGGWVRREVGVGAPDREVVAVAPDPQAGFWAAVAYPQRVVEQAPPTEDEAAPPTTTTIPAAIGFVRLTPGEADFPYPTQVLDTLSGPLRIGVLQVNRPNEAVAALYWQHPRGGLGPAGLAWIDPRGRSLTRIGPALPTVDGKPTLPDGRITDMATAADGTVYLGTRSGLVRYRDGVTKVFDENDFMDSESVNCLGVDPLQRIWVGTDEGLGLVQGNDWRPIRHPLIDGVAINALTFEPGGEIWLGTADGLIRGDGQRFQVVQGRRKRPLRNVRSLAWDGKGGLWVLTDQGIWHRAPR